MKRTGKPTSAGPCSPDRKLLRNWREPLLSLAIHGMHTRIASQPVPEVMVGYDWEGIIGFFRGPLLFHSFDADYLERLASGDPTIERHFSLYFSDLLGLKLRVRIRSAQLIEDIRQETLLRVIQIVRTRGVDHPERFGAFVSAVCNNVLMEQVRAESRHDHWESEPEIT